MSALYIPSLWSGVVSKIHHLAQQCTHSQTLYFSDLNRFQSQMSSTFIRQRIKLKTKTFQSYQISFEKNFER